MQGPHHALILEDDEAQFAFAVMTDERDLWHANRRALDTKAGTILALLLAWVALVSGLAGMTEHSTDSAGPFLLWLLAVALVVGLGFGLKGLLVEAIHWLPFTGPVTDSLARRRGLTVSDVQRAAVAQFLDVYRPLIERGARSKAGAVKWATGALVFSVPVGLALLLNVEGVLVIALWTGAAVACTILVMLLTP